MSARPAVLLASSGAIGRIICAPTSMPLDTSSAYASWK